jgi:hypothetical protein
MYVLYLLYVLYVQYIHTYIVRARCLAKNVAASWQAHTHPLTHPYQLRSSFLSTEYVAFVASHPTRPSMRLDFSFQPSHLGL